MSRLSNTFLIQWGRIAGTGAYWGHIITFPISFTTIVNPAVIIDWGDFNAWYTSSDYVRCNGVTNISGAPYSITLNSMGVQSLNTHRWIVIGY